MPKKITKAQLKRLQKNGAVVQADEVTKLVEQVSVPIDTSSSSEEMKLVINSMNDNTKKLIESTNNSNGVLLRSVVDIVKNNNITGIDINRGDDKLMTSVTFKRG